MVQFYNLKVKEIKQETPDAISITFDVPDDLKSTFKYKAGQFLTLRVNVYGEQVRRPYSLCSSPALNEDPKVTTKRVEGGVLSNYLNDHLKEGDEIEVFPPMGKFTTEYEPDNQRTLILLGGGSGITPLMSHIKTLLHKEPKSMAFLFYGNQDKESIIFDEELRELKTHYAERFKLIHTLENPPDNWHEEVGRLDRQKILKLLDDYAVSSDDNVEYFICGPQGMINESEKALEQRGIAKEHIHIEYFTTPLHDIEEAMKAEASGEEEEAEEEDFEEAEVTILMDGEEFTIAVSKHETILDAAIEEDYDPPYACQMGICTTCMAFLHEGNVTMYEDEGLSDAEKDEGYILTCQSRPTTPKVKVEYE